MDFTELFMSILLTAVSYMAFPFIRLLINGEKFDKKQAHKIALWNSIICGLVFCIAASAADTTWNAFPAILYYWINYAIIADRTKKESNNEIEHQKEELQINLQEEHSNEPPEEKGKEDQKIEEFEHLNRLYFQRKEEFKKAKTKRIVMTGIVLAILYFMLFVFICLICNGEMFLLHSNSVDIDVVANFILFAVLAIVAAGFHILITIASGYSSKKSKEENEILDNIITRMRQLEREIH